MKKIEQQFMRYTAERKDKKIDILVYFTSGCWSINFMWGSIALFRDKKAHAKNTLAHRLFALLTNLCGLNCCSTNVSLSLAYFGLCHVIQWLKIIKSVLQKYTAGLCNHLKNLAAPVPTVGDFSQFCAVSSCSIQTWFQLNMVLILYKTIFSS